MKFGNWLSKRPRRPVKLLVGSSVEESESYKLQAAGSSPALPTKTNRI